MGNEIAKIDHNYDNQGNYVSNQSTSKSTTNYILANGLGQLGSYLGNQTNNFFQDSNSEWGHAVGNVFSSGVNSAFNTASNNLFKGQTLSQGLLQDAGGSMAGAAIGTGANYLGRGINNLGGNTALSRGIGQGVATGVGTVGAQAVSNLIKYGSIAGKIGENGKRIGLIGKGAGSINPYGLAATVVGSALGAATGPSKEYNGRYGKTTQIMDTAYDALTVAANVIPGWGQLASGLMTLNKGLSNVFGSTDGMTQTDAILGSAFMPAPLKWANMWGANTTGSFNNQSWQNNEKATTFIGDAFGNLQDRFDTAREEAGKTYGTFSKSAYRNAQRNLDFSNYAWNKILDMADQNELQNIRSQEMSSINNQRYAQNIQGGWTPIYRGKQGMKIFNNATNHSIGMRLLSAAALIDNKQMILCNALD